MIHQPFICSYPKDYPWLEHLLWSLGKFGRQLAPPAVCVAGTDVDGARGVIRAAGSNAVIVAYDAPLPCSGMMRAMIAMMLADSLTVDLRCPEFIWLFGSDCLVTEEINPRDFFDGDRPVMCYTPYAKFTGLYPDGLKWQAGVERILGLRPEHEFMRRLPGVYPQSIFRPVRAAIADQQFNDQAPIRHMPDRKLELFLRFCCERGGDDFSEANLIGAWAWRNAHDAFAWQQTEFNPVLQFWSHGGMDRPCDGDVMYRGGNARGKTPRQIIEETRR